MAGGMTGGIAIAGLAIVISSQLASGGEGTDGDRAPEPAVTAPMHTEAPGEDVSAQPPATPDTPLATVSPEPTPEPIEPPEPDSMYALGDTGDGVRELQARLRQIQWYLTDVTGEFDDVTTQAVQGFQAKRGFDPTGDVDDQTWDRLVEMTKTPTEDEKHNRLVAGPTIIGPDDAGDEVRELQARLKQIGWFDHEVTGNYGSITSSAVAGFQTKRGIPSTGEVDQKTWDLLAGMTRTPTEAELTNKPPEPSADASGLPAECLTGRVLCIDKSDQVLRWVTSGDVHVTLDARFGSELTPTREGMHEVYWKSRDHVSSLYNTPMPYAMFFDGGQAVHYSPDFAANGYNGASHGCVNIRDKDTIAWLFDQVREGDKVYVYWS
jgi:peptidoglycan hydrolase-like protein with peptidoglycan-binding domain